IAATPYAMFLPPELARGGWIDNGHSSGVLARKLPAADHRNAHRFEIVLAHDAIVDLRPFSRSDRFSFNRKKARNVVRSERHAERYSTRRADGNHSGKSFQFVLDAVIQSLPLLRLRILLSGNAHVHNNEVVGSKSRLHVQQPNKTLNQQTRSNEQHERQSHFHDDKDTPK